MPRRGVGGLYLPADSLWLNPIKILWRQFCREVTHGELFASLDTLLKAAHAFFDLYNQHTERILSIIRTSGITFVVVLKPAIHRA